MTKCMVGAAVAIAACAGCKEQVKDLRGPIAPGKYVVTFKTDDLSSIAIRAYGDIDLWYGLLNANRMLCTRPGFDLIIGETLTIPRKEDLDMSLPKSVFPKILPAEYIVLPGDNLYFIAKGCYGDKAMWEVIYDANRDTLSERVKEKKDELIAGQVLKIPLLGQPEE